MERTKKVIWKIVYLLDDTKIRIAVLGLPTILWLVNFFCTVLPVAPIAVTYTQKIVIYAILSTLVLLGTLTVQISDYLRDTKRH